VLSPICWELGHEPKEKRCCEPEQQPSVERFHCSQQLPTQLYLETCVSVGRHRSHRIKHRKSGIGHCSNQEISYSPNRRFDRVQASCKQGCRAHSQRKANRWVSIPHQGGIERDETVLHDSETQHMQSNGEHNQGAPKAQSACHGEGCRSIRTLRKASATVIDYPQALAHF